MGEVSDDPSGASAHIAEAVFDVRVAQLEACALERLDHFGGNDLPARCGPLMTNERHAPRDPSPTASRSSELNGYKFASRDGDRIVQVRLDGFAFSQLPPYGDWQTFYPQAREQWMSYAACVGQVKLVRLALRYVHHIRMPAGEDLLDKYLTVRPEIPQGEFGALSGFFMAADLPLPDKGVEARIVETVFASDDEVPQPVLVLDLDVSMFLDEKVWDELDDAVWIDEIFTNLHKAKDELLHNSITDDTRRLLT